MIFVAKLHKKILVFNENSLIFELIDFYLDLLLTALHKP